MSVKTDRLVPGAMFGVVSESGQRAMILLVVGTVRWRSFVAAAVYCFCKRDGVPKFRDPQSWHPLPDISTEMADGAALIIVSSDAGDLSGFEYIETLPAPIVGRFPNPVFKTRDAAVVEYDFDASRRDNIYERLVSATKCDGRIWPYLEIGGYQPGLDVGRICPCVEVANDDSQGRLF